LGNGVESAQLAGNAPIIVDRNLRSEFGLSLRRQRNHSTHTSGIESRTEDSDHFRKGKLSGAMTCRRALDFPFAIGFAGPIAKSRIERIF